MKNRNKQILQRRQVLFVTAMYFLVATLYVFYLPNLTLSVNHHNSISKTKVETVLPSNFLERTDKATFKQTIKIQATNAPVAYLTFPFNEPGAKAQRLNAFASNPSSFPHCCSSFISLRVFKI